jgi:hypothetical protein
LDAQITSTGFDENLPLREFEGYFGISSYWASIEAGEMSYMNGTLAYDPDTAAVTADDILRTFMNTSTEVIIGENTIAATRGGPFEDPCYTYLRASEKHPYASGKEVKIVGEWHGTMLLFFRHSVSKTKSRIAKSGGGWKKWPAVMDGGLDGTRRKKYCENPSYYEIPNKAQNRKRIFLNSRIEVDINGSYAYEEAMISRHYIAGNNYSLPLIW